MQVINYVNDAGGQLMFFPKEKIVSHHFERTLDSKQLKTILGGGVDVLKKYGAQKWLSDNRQLVQHSAEDGQWINAFWVPSAIAAGWKYWALIVPEQEHGRMNMAEFVTTFYNQGIRVMVFTDFKCAWEWLLDVDNKS